MPPARGPFQWVCKGSPALPGCSWQRPCGACAASVAGSWPPLSATLAPLRGLGQAFEGEARAAASACAVKNLIMWASKSCKASAPRKSVGSCPAGSTPRRARAVAQQGARKGEHGQLPSREHVEKSTGSCPAGSTPRRARAVAQQGARRGEHG
eukprot:355022-Chlamydomonas_euryale.AAC.8